MNVEVRSFNDVNQHARAIEGWQQEYDQLGRGSLSSSLKQVSTHTIQMFQEVLNRQVLQRGCCPRKRICIAVADGEGGVSLNQRRPHSETSVFLLRDQEDFMLHAPEGMTLLAANLDMERLLRLADLHLSDHQRKLMLSVSILSVSDEAAKRLRESLRVILRHSTLVHQRSSSVLVLDKIVDELLASAFLDVFSSVDHSRHAERRESAVCQYLVRRSRELLESNACSPLSILELCERLKVSRRTLQASFQTVAGIGPLEYLRDVRLNAVRRRLGTTTSSELQVGDAAAEMGFFHLSHFARNYKELFGELPSETPRADSSPGLLTVASMARPLRKAA
jgi:AraC family transcriptional regulator, ethanolamine operon transcriptional activator